MGECGCAMDNEIGRLKAPNGWYVINLYPGCEECQQITGIYIVFYTDQQFKEYHLDYLPDLTAAAAERDWRGADIPVLKWEYIAKQAKKLQGDGEVGITEYDNISDLIADCNEAIRLAVIDTIDEWNKRRLQATGQEGK